MELKKAGWVNMFDQLEVSEFIQGYKNMAYPNKVIVLVGENCGSSCEQFVLYAQQNPNVTTMGQRTYGALDASNVREKANTFRENITFLCNNLCISSSPTKYRYSWHPSRYPVASSSKSSNF